MGQPRRSHLKEFQVRLDQQRSSLGIRVLCTSVEALPAGFVSAHSPEEGGRKERLTKGSPFGDTLNQRKGKCHTSLLHIGVLVYSLNQNYLSHLWQAHPSSSAQTARSHFKSCVIKQVCKKLA